MSDPHIFCGILPAGTANSFLQIVIGKIEENWTEYVGAGLPRTADLTDLMEIAIESKQSIMLTDPILIHRCAGMMMNPDTKQQQMVITHQFVEDPYWRVSRGMKMPFNLGLFLTARIMDAENPKDSEEIRRYKQSLEDTWAKISGLVKPEAGLVLPFKK